MISSMTVWPIIAALMGMINFLCQDLQPLQALDLALLCPTVQVQKNFIQRYNPLLSDLQLFKQKELRTWASHDIEWLNRILAQEGFSIRLTPSGSPYAFGVVSIMDICVQWLHAGTVTSVIDAAETEYAAFDLDKGFEVYSIHGYAHPALCIKTQTEDTVWITIADDQVADMALLDTIMQVRARSTERLYGYKHAIIPMINYDETAELNWLKGLGTHGYAISQALQQTKFKMNERGARVQSAVAIMMECCISRNVVIDKPFFVWIERPGMHEPLFVGYMDQQYWKNPGDINA